MLLRPILQTVRQPVLRRPSDPAPMMFGTPAAPSMALGMLLGMNLGFVTDYSGMVPFSNLCLQGRAWERLSGTGAWTNGYGLLNAAVPTDEFRMIVNNTGEALTSGTYTLLNPEGLDVGVGTYNGPGWLPYSTATQRTFTYDPASGANICLFVKGSVTQSVGNVAIIIPNCLSSYQGGDIWNPAYISFLQGLHLRTLRFMDWGCASQNWEAQWSHRTPANAISFFNPYANSNVVPYERMIELANRLGADPWICVPGRADDNYVTQLATLVSSQLNPSRKLWLEYSNETWNYGAPWHMTWSWLQYPNHTKRLATAIQDGSNSFTLASHDLVDGDAVATWTGSQSLENNVGFGVGAYAWMFTYGSTSYVKRLTTDTFALYAEPEFVNIIPFNSRMIDILFVKVSETATVPVNTAHGQRTLAIWDLVDAVLGAGRVTHLMPSQAAASNVTADRLAPTGVRERTDYVAIAPYFAAVWWGAAVDIASGQLTPKFWRSSGTGTVTCGVYAQGSIPTMQEIIGGAGAGFVEKTSFTATAPGWIEYVTGPAITGLTDGVTYDVFFAVPDSTGGSWELAGSATVSASPSTVSIMEDHAQFQARELVGIIETATGVQAHQVASGGLPVVCYEGGSHYDGNVPAEILTWLFNYQNTQFHGDAISYYLHQLANNGAKEFTYYADLYNGSRFKIAEFVTDIADPRYVAYAAANGAVTVGDNIAIENVTASNVLVEPSFPYAVTAFPNATLTYSIYSGDRAGRYSIVGNVLRMVNANGVAWDDPEGQSIVILAKDTTGKRVGTFSVTFNLGQAWFESDANFAWDAFYNTTDTGVMVPRTSRAGNVLTRTAGVEATITPGWWDINGLYEGSVQISAPQFHTSPFMFAATMDRDNFAGSSFANLIKIGNNPEIRICHDGAYGSNSVGFYAAGTVGALELYLQAETPWTNGPKVIWLFYDPATRTFTYGLNQTTVGASAPINPRTDNTGPYTWVYDTGIKLGAMQTVIRTGMTVADAKAVVQKMQTLHSIS